MLDSVGMVFYTYTYVAVGAGVCRSGSLTGFLRILSFNEMVFVIESMDNGDWMLFLFLVLFLLLESIMMVSTAVDCILL